LAIVANEGQVAVDASARETNGLMRTVKSWGPDAPVLASRTWEANASHGQWWQESRSPGRPRI